MINLQGVINIIKMKDKDIGNYIMKIIILFLDKIETGAIKYRPLLHLLKMVFKSR